MFRTVAATSAVILVAYIALTIPTVMTVNNLINQSQNERINVHRAEINSLKRRVSEIELRIQQH